MRNFHRSLSAFVIFALTLSACSTFSSKGETEPGVLRVGINTSYPPLGFEQDGKVQGIEADFAQMLGKQLGKEVRFVPLPLKDLIPALDKNRIDIIMAGMSVTEARSKKVAFCEPYARVGQMALIREQDFNKYRAANALNWPTSRVGVKAHSTGERFAKQLSGAKVVEFNTVEEGIAALRAGQIDFFIHDAPTIWRVAGTPLKPDPELVGLYTPLTEEYLAWAVRTDDTATRDQLNALVLKWKTDGQIQTVLDKWVPIRRVAKNPLMDSPPKVR